MIKIKVQIISQMLPSSKCPYQSSRFVTPLQLLTLSPLNISFDDAPETAHCPGLLRPLLHNQPGVGPQCLLSLLPNFQWNM